MLHSVQQEFLCTVIMCVVHGTCTCTWQYCAHFRSMFWQICVTSHMILLLALTIWLLAFSLQQINILRKHTYHTLAHIHTLGVANTMSCKPHFYPLTKVFVEGAIYPSWITRGINTDRRYYTTPSLAYGESVSYLLYLTNLYVDCDQQETDPSTHVTSLICALSSYVCS
jgi:multidrug transporter EmrE-like cation transporter